MKKKNILLACIALFAFSFNGSAQPYCSPTFTNGCTSWDNQAITLDSIQWTIGSTACTVSDYTTLHTTLVKGVAMPMAVTNGTWCGVGVWIDFNHDYAFDDSENLFFKYIALATQTYNFSITVPATVANGTYRMRVVAGWGTDCFTTSANGYGACGTYQYGNYDDFTIKVVDPLTAINHAPETKLLQLGPNPVNIELSVKVDAALVNSTYKLTNTLGEIVMEGKLNSENTLIDVSALSAGIYVFSTGADPKNTVKVIKK